MKKKVLIISTSLYGGGAEKVPATLLRNIDYSLYETIASLLESPKMLSEYKKRAIKRSSVWGMENSLKQFYKLISNDCL